MNFLRWFLALFCGVLISGCGSDVAKESDPAPEVVGSFSAKGVMQLSQGIGQELETIRSVAVMLPVAGKLGLKERWTMDSVEEAAIHLGKNVQLEPMRGTDLVEVRYIGVDAAFAITAVDEIMASYRSHQVAIAKSETAAGVEDLGKEIVQYQNALRDAEPSPKTLASRDRSNHPRTSTPYSEELAEMRSKLKALEGKQGIDLVEAALKAELANRTLTERAPQLEAIRAEASELEASGLGSSHPKRIQAENMASVLEKMLVESVEVSRKNLQSKLRIFELNVDKQPLSDEMRKEIQTKLDAAVEQLKSMQIELQTPQSKVVIHERAQVER